MPSSFEETLPKDSVTAAEYARLTALHKAQDVARALAAAGDSGQQPPVLIIGADTVVEYGEHILEKPAGGWVARGRGELAGFEVAELARRCRAGQPCFQLACSPCCPRRPWHADANDARRVLQMLSGKRHHVHTGVALVMPQILAGGGAVVKRVAECPACLRWSTAQVRAAAGRLRSTRPVVPACHPADGDPPHHSFAVTTNVEFDALSPAAIDAYVASGEPFDKAGSYGAPGCRWGFYVRAGFRLCCCRHMCCVAALRSTCWRCAELALSSPPPCHSRRRHPGAGG